ncbi:MAG: hypothetical protein A4S09_05670 [Proteobacteria bacterium SG_bin7]|nr:MAG: hypothetical protein A4S09_05670 [Proteobacteria bacterium SG_bin7]
MSQKFDVLKKFFETNATSKKALGLLAKGTEIGIILESGETYALIASPNGPQFVERPAQEPDITFRLNDVAISNVCLSPKENPEELAVQILKEIKHKNVHLMITGSFVSIATKGYFSIIRLGGKNMWDFLTEHGITSFFKITSLIKEMIK